MEFLLGFGLSLLVGITLGLIGGGGSILTVPILVYVFGISPQGATVYSLFIVGITSLVGAGGYHRNHLVDLRTALAFVVPSLVAVFLMRQWVMPLIPEHIVTLAWLDVTKSVLIMAVFAVLMIAASFSMILQNKRAIAHASGTGDFNYPLIFGEGIVVGSLTGFVGAGGGFLIIPTLVVLARLPMKIAIGTSLLIIAINTLLGFTVDLSSGAQIQWPFLLEVSVFTVGGLFVGMALAKRIPGEKLKPAFGWFVLAMGVWILTKELILK